MNQSTKKVLRQIRIIIAVILAPGLLIAYYYNVPKYLLHFVLAVVILVFEVDAYKVIRQIIAQGDFFKIRSRTWIQEAFMYPAMIYFFTDQPMNIWNIIAISALVLSGISKIIRGTSAYCRVAEDGVWNLYTHQKLIAAEDITQVNVSAAEISIDTKKYRNELLVKAKNLREPAWKKLTNDLSRLEKVWVKQQ